MHRRVREQRKYEKEYKLEAVKPAQGIGAGKAAKELGIPVDTLYGWRKAAREGRLDAGPGSRGPGEAMSLAAALSAAENRPPETVYPFVFPDAIHNKVKKIYTAVTLDEEEENLLQFGKKWRGQYPSCVKSWEENWEVLSAFYEYPPEVRKIIYTTNMIQGLGQAQFSQRHP